MAAQRREGLVLQRVDAAVELVAAALIRASRPDRAEAVGAGDANVEDRRNGAPDVGDGLARRARRRRARDGRPAVEELYVRGQRNRDANEAVLRQVREVVRGRAVDAEVVGVDRAKQRVVDARRGHRREPSLGGRGRELEALRWHVTVGAGAAVGAEAGKRPIAEVRLAAAERALPGNGWAPVVQPSASSKGVCSSPPPPHAAMVAASISAAWNWRKWRRWVMSVLLWIGAGRSCEPAGHNDVARAACR